MMKQTLLLLMTMLLGATPAQARIFWPDYTDGRYTYNVWDHSDGELFCIEARDYERKIWLRLSAEGYVVDSASVNLPRGVVVGTTVVRDKVTEDFYFLGKAGTPVYSLKSNIHNYAAERQQDSLMVRSSVRRGVPVFDMRRPPFWDLIDKYCKPKMKKEIWTQQQRNR